MKRLIAPLAIVAASLSIASVASAQEDSVPPDSGAVVADHDDDSDNTGLWGLLGLAGLAGLAGLKRRNEPTGTGYNQPVSGTAPKRADGATGSTTTH
jgi:hypothetical protein